MRAHLNLLGMSALVAIATSTPALAATEQRWGALSSYDGWHWTTTNEARPRVSVFRWDQAGRHLIIEHGFASVLSPGAPWADTVQKIVAKPNGEFISTYTFSDGRPILITDMSLQADGSIVESFTRPDGSRQRNRYLFTGTTHTIVREREVAGSWAMLGTTNKIGMSSKARELASADLVRQQQQQFARWAAEDESKRVAREQEREEQALDREEQAQRQAEAKARGGPNTLTVLRDMGAVATAEANREQRELRGTIERGIEEERSRKAEDARRLSETMAARERSGQDRRIGIANTEQERRAEAFAVRQRSRVELQRARPQGPTPPREIGQVRSNIVPPVAPAPSSNSSTSRSEAAEVCVGYLANDRERDCSKPTPIPPPVNSAIDKGQTQSQLLTWQEGVAVCDEHKPGRWQCRGPRDSSSFYASMTDNLKEVCRNARPLGSQGNFVIFGCGYGISPNDNSPFRESHHYDWIKALGLRSPSGRMTFRCKAQFNHCTSR